MDVDRMKFVDAIRYFLKNREGWIKEKWPIPDNYLNKARECVDTAHDKTFSDYKDKAVAWLFDGGEWLPENFATQESWFEACAEMADDYVDRGGKCGQSPFSPGVEESSAPE